MLFFFPFPSEKCIPHFLTRKSCKVKKKKKVDVGDIFINTMLEHPYLPQQLEVTLMGYMGYLYDE